MRWFRCGWLDEAVEMHALGGDARPNRTAMGSLYDSSANRSVSRLNVRSVLPPAAAEDDPTRPTPLGQLGRVAFPAAVMRGQQHVARQRLLGQQATESLFFEIARQKDSSSEGLDRQHDAVGVVRAEDAAAQRMEDFAVASLQAVAGVDFADRNAVPVESRAEFGQQAVGFVEHDRRNIDHTDRKPFEQFGQGVEVVGVGVRNHHRVDVRQTFVPEELGDRSGAAVRRAKLTGVVENRLARGEFQQRGTTVSDAEERAIEPVGCSSISSRNNTDNDPHGQQAQAPPFRRPQTRKGHNCA